MIIHVPGPLLEAVDGAFLVLLFFMFGTTSHYATRMAARDWHSSRRLVNRWSIETKASWALAIIFLGLILRVGSHWCLRHAANHGLHWDALVSAGPAIILVSTVMTTWGSVCWIRTVIPLRFGSQAWTAASVIAIAFGVGMAL